MFGFVKILIISVESYSHLVCVAEANGRGICQTLDMKRVFDCVKNLEYNEMEEVCL